MAKKTTVPKIKKGESLDEHIKKHNPLYMQICDNSKQCEVASKTVDLEDMILEVCPQCYNKRAWCKKEVVKVEKPKKTTAKATKETQAEEAATVAETPVVAMPTIAAPVLEKAPVLTEMDEEIKKNAQATQAMFASVDKMVSEVIEAPAPVQASAAPKPIAPPVIAPPIPAPIPAPVSAAANVPLGVPIMPQSPVAPVFSGPTTGLFTIVSVEIKSATEAALICETNLKKRFVIKATSEPEKIAMLASNPNLVVGMNAKAEFSQVNPDGTPVAPKYLAIVPPAQ